MSSNQRRRPLHTSAALSLTLLACLATGCSQAAQQDDSERNESGTIVGDGDVGVFALRVGDCIDASGLLGKVEQADPTEITEVEEFAALPCTELHSGEVITNDKQFYAEFDSIPTNDELLESGSERCTTDLESYTGTEYDTSIYEFLPLIPTAESWEAIDDRGLICIGVTLDQSLTDVIDTTSSIKAAG
jgi:hypothetical protein